jgi:hypothetical protein
MNAGTAGGGSVEGPATAAGAGGAGVTPADVGGGDIAAKSSTTTMTTATTTASASTSAAAPPDSASAILVRIFIRRAFSFEDQLFISRPSLVRRFMLLTVRRPTGIQ